MTRFRIAWLLLFGLTFPIALRAEVRLPHVIGDHAVLQRDRPIALPKG